MPVVEQNDTHTIENSFGLEVLNTKSEDITIIDSKAQKYFRFQSEIRKVIIDSKERYLYVEDIVSAISKIDSIPVWQNVLTLGIGTFLNYIKHKKLERVVETIIKKIFDITLGWYTMDYDDLKETCDFVGGKGYFTVDDHQLIYKAVMQKLKEGIIRDKCIELGIINFVNEKLTDIKDNYLIFKIKEL